MNETKPITERERVHLHDRLCQSIIAWLLSQGVYAWMTTGYGVGDVMACADGRFVSIEVKTGKAHQLTKAQVRFRDGVLRSGGHYLIAQSLDDVQFAMKNLRKRDSQ